MNRFVALVACSWCFCFAAQAAKDCPAGDSPGAMGDLEIVDVTATVKITADVARASWRVVMKNSGQGPARASLDFATDAVEAPLVVTGVQISGRRDAVLTNAAVAADAFNDFTTAMENGVDEAIAGSARTAIHAAMTHGGGVTVNIAAACSQRRVVVHVEGAVQSLPRNGGAQFVLPRLTARDRVTIHADDADVWAAGRSLPASAVIAVEASFVDDTEGERMTDDLVIEVRQQHPRLHATGIVRTIADNTLVQAALDLPAPLTTTATDLRIVFVVDASVSAGDAGVQMALRLVERVLDEAPAETRWSLITATRTPRLLVGAWRARDDRFIPTIVVDNGSDIPAAIRMATGIAKDVEGTGRVIVLSDLQLATAHESTLAASLVPAVADRERAVPVLHLVALPIYPADGHLGWDRLKDEPIVTDTERSGGVFIGTHEGNDGDNNEYSLARYLIRPTRLDDVQLFVDGAPFVDGDGDHDVDVYGSDGKIRAGQWPLILDEGEGLRLSHVLPASFKHAELRARAWSTPIVLPIDSVDALAAAGTAINGQLREAAMPEVVAAVATTFGFVSSMTSFLDVPKWRPAHTDLGGSGYNSSCGCSCLGHGFGRRGFGQGCGIRTAVVLKAQQILDDLAAEIAATCKADVHAEIEIGDLEILAVSTTKGATKRQTGCVRELLWAARLDRLTPGDGSFEHHTVFTMNSTFSAERTLNGDDVDDADG